MYGHAILRLPDSHAPLGGRDLPGYRRALGLRAQTLPMKPAPIPLAFHGIVIRVREPEAVARTIRELLGWRTLSRGAHDIVLGEGPELFLAIRKTGRGETEGVESLHLAVERLSRSRRRSAPDALGGDSWTRPLIGDLALTVREFRRAPGSRWRAKRKKPER